MTEYHFKEGTELVRDNKKSHRIFDMEQVNERINNLDRLLEKVRRDKETKVILSDEEEKCTESLHGNDDRIPF